MFSQPTEGRAGIEPRLMGSPCLLAAPCRPLVASLTQKNSVLVLA